MVNVSATLILLKYKNPCKLSKNFIWAIEKPRINIDPSALHVGVTTAPVVTKVADVQFYNIEPITERNKIVHGMAPTLKSLFLFPPVPVPYTWNVFISYLAVTADLVDFINTKLHCIDYTT